MPYRDPEQRREYKRQWYARNREKIREQKAQYYQENRGALLKASRERYLRSPDTFRQRARDYNQRNHEEILAKRRRAYLENRDAQLISQTFSRHGLRPEDWAAVWDTQDGRCYLCGELMDRKQVNIDHDHSHCSPGRSCSQCRRGLACMDCNIAIGYARDDPARLRRMADALEAAQLAFQQRRAFAGQEQLPLPLSD